MRQSAPMRSGRWVALACLVACVSARDAHAGLFGGGGGVSGGATEATQLLNHAELVESVARQAELVEQALQAQITRLQNLAQMHAATLSRAMQPYQTQASGYQALYGAVVQLRVAADRTNGLFGRSMAEMSSAGLSPSQWLSAYTQLAVTRGGLYQQQLNADLGNLGALADRAANLQRIEAQIPGVTGNVQGLQLLNQQSNVLAGEMVDLHALIARQVAQQMQDRLAQTAAQRDAAQEQQAWQASAAQLDAVEKAQINGGRFDLLNDRPAGP